MATLDELVVRIRADSSQLERELRRTTGMVENSTGRMGAAFGVLRSQLLTLVPAVSVAAVVGFTKSAIDAAGALQDMADRTGASASFLSAMEAQAVQAGASLSDVAQAISFMNNSIGEAAKGNQAMAESFSRLNIDLEHLKSLSPEEQFYLITQRISELGTQFERTEAARNIFGRGVNNLLPIIREGGDAIKDMNQALIDQGNALSAEHIAVLDEFGDAMARTATTIKNSFISAVAESIIAIQRLLGVAAMGGTALSREIADAEALVVEREAKIAAMERRMAEGMRGGMAESSLRIQKQELDEARKSLDDLRESYNKLNRESYGPELAPQKTPRPKAAGGAIGDTSKGRKEATAEIKEMATATQELGREFQQIEDQSVQTTRIIKDSFADAVESAMFDFENFGRAGASILEGLARNIARTRIIDPLSNSVGGLFDSLLPSATSFFGGFFAEGGRPPVGRPSIVGEKGPEVFVPDAAGTVIPNGGFGGTSVVVHQTINMSPGLPETVNAALARSMPGFMAATQTAVFQAIERGGSEARLVGKRN